MNFLRSVEAIRQAIGIQVASPGTHGIVEDDHGRHPSFRIRTQLLHGVENGQSSAAHVDDATGAPFRSEVIEEGEILCVGLKLLDLYCNGSRAKHYLVVRSV